MTSFLEEFPVHDRTARRRKQRGSFVALCVWFSSGAFISSTRADETMQTLSCIYSSHSEITADHKLRFDARIGTWKINDNYVTGATATKYEFSIPIVKNDPNYLVASTATASDGSFHLVVFDKKLQSLTETRVGPAGAVLTEQTGDCHTRPWVPLRVF
jgi:hypothetical protein